MIACSIICLYCYPNKAKGQLAELLESLADVLGVFIRAVDPEELWANITTQIHDVQVSITAPGPNWAYQSLQHLTFLVITEKKLNTHDSSISFAYIICCV